MFRKTTLDATPPRDEYRTGQKRSGILPAAISMLVLILGLGVASQAAAVTVINGGFEDETGWALANDATLAYSGGAAPWSWDTPMSAIVSVDSSENLFPTEGGGMGITYAGADSFTQLVEVETAGDYLFSVDANAVTGTGSMGQSLLDGAFEMFAGSASSTDFSVAASDGWINYTWLAALDVGAVEIGIRNTLTAVYSIAFDNFSVTDMSAVSPVPVPASFWLFGTALVGFVGISRRRFPG